MCIAARVNITDFDSVHRMRGGGDEIHYRVNT